MYGVGVMKVDQLLPPLRRRLPEFLQKHPSKPGKLEKKASPPTTISSILSSYQPHPGGLGVELFECPDPTLRIILTVMHELCAVVKSKNLTIFAFHYST